MARPLRLEFAGAWYHVMNRGARKQSIFETDRDRHDLLSLLAEIDERFEAEVHGYCLMSNHYHLLLRTQKPNLSKVMRHINGVYTQRFNQRNNVDGPLFRGRFLSQVVDTDAYLLQVSRYIHRNPVEAQFVRAASQYRWSSFNAFTGTEPHPPWLHMDQVLNMVGGPGPRRTYAEFVEKYDPDEDPRASQVGDPTSGVLGSKKFAESAQQQADATSIGVRSRET